MTSALLELTFCSCSRHSQLDVSRLVQRSKLLLYLTCLHLFAYAVLIVLQSVPLMLLAVQQMVDALSALNITHKLLATMEQPTSQPQQPSMPFTTNTAANLSTSTADQTGDVADSNSNGSSGGSSGGGQGASAEQCVQWQQQLLLQELVMPIDGSFRELLTELGVLVGMVGLHVRAPTDASRVTLLGKVRPEPIQAGETGTAV